MLHSSEDEANDDEIFFGKFSLKEFKKHVMWTNHGQIKSLDTIIPEQDCDSSFQLIQTHSQPNLRLRSYEFSSVPGSPSLDKKSDESVIEMENMVSKLCMSPGEAENLEQNNTLEVIDYILNNGPNQNINKTDTEKEIENEKKKELELNKICSQSPLPSKTSPIKVLTPSHASPKKKETGTEKEIENEQKKELELNKICSQSPLPSKTSPIKVLTPSHASPKKKETGIKASPKYFTPAMSAKKQQADVFVTPSLTNLKAKTLIFKTPATPISQKKPSVSSLRKTPSKTNAYQHIASPIASYINNCPQAPLVKNVHPRKPLPGPSSIPKFVKNPLPKLNNKENINLPSIAYKSAKKTKVIDVPDEEKLPQSQFVKKMISTLPRPTVMKHEHREMNFAKKTLLNQQEESFENLSCLQADVSVCTQKTAFKTNKQK